MCTPSMSVLAAAWSHAMSRSAAMSNVYVSRSRNRLTSAGHGITGISEGGVRPVRSRPSSIGRVDQPGRRSV